MQQVLYSETENKAHWQMAIAQSDWGAGKHLASLLQTKQLQNAEVLLLTEGKTLLAYCTLAQQDNVDAPQLTPWIGYVYTFPAFRGRGLIKALLNHAKNLACQSGAENLYISTKHQGLYEKYGYTFLETRNDITGEPTRVYHLKIKE